MRLLCTTTAPPIQVPYRRPSVRPCRPSERPVMRPVVGLPLRCFSLPLLMVVATAISTSVGRESGISEAASSRGLVTQHVVKVTRPVTAERGLGAFAVLLRLLVRVTRLCFP